MANRPRVIGITGGIGCGKSYVSAMLQKAFDIPVYDCDKEAKRLTATSEEIRCKLIALVGPDVFDGNQLNRKCLADYLFASNENASMVNAIVHPAVMQDFQQWAAAAKQPIVGMESAILFESGFHTTVDIILFVDAPQEVRLSRAMQRDTATEAQIKARMKMQQPETYKEKADFIIDNGTADDSRLLEQLNETIIPLLKLPT